MQNNGIGDRHFKHVRIFSNIKTLFNTLSVPIVITSFPEITFYGCHIYNEY